MAVIFNMHIAIVVIAILGKIEILEDDHIISRHRSNPEEIDLMAGENRQSPYLSINASGQTPALELDDGTIIAEITAICEYLDDVTDGKTLIGNTPLVLLKGPSEATGCEIWGKCEYANPGGSVKDRAALYIVRDAEATGSLRPGGTIVEALCPTAGSIRFDELDDWDWCRSPTPEDGAGLLHGTNLSLQAQGRQRRQALVCLSLQH